MNRIKKWFFENREGRTEEGTSNDMCPTNGDALVMSLGMTALCLIVVACYCIEKGGGK